MVNLVTGTRRRWNRTPPGLTDRQDQDAGLARWKPGRQAGQRRIAGRRPLRRPPQALPCQAAIVKRPAARPPACRLPAAEPGDPS